MSWFSNLVTAYERVEDIVGVADANGNVLLPPNHMAKNSGICIVLDGEGRFLRAEESAQNILIPRTDRSEFSRTSIAIAPHPLHEELGYLALKPEHRKQYLQLISSWSARHPKVSAVHRYIEGGTICSDLQQSGIDTDTENAKKLFVRFRVEIPGDLTPNLWEDVSVSNVWQAFCGESQGNGETLCYATGISAHPAKMHPKGINPITGSAKLISCNDETNYTYRGRFTKSHQANAVSASASHKAHAMLRYLIATQGHKCDTQAVVAFSVNDASAQANLFADTYGLYESLVKTDSERHIDAQGQLDADYAESLRNALTGMGKTELLQNQQRTSTVAVMAVDAATTGRMGITFYQQLPENEYIERVLAWHESCRWWFRYKGQNILTAPAANRIIAAVYGEARGEGYAKIQKQARERLLANIVCNVPMDFGWVRAAVARVSQPFSFTKRDGGWDKYGWDNALSVTCAITRHYYQQKKEDIPLELDKTCSDRNYLFGRLLAIAGKLESHARYVQTGGNDTEKRPTNAVRYMSAFAAKPLRTWKLLVDQLNPYMQRLNGAEWYQQQIDDILALFGPDDFTDQPLNGKYLLGYSLQRKALRKDTHNKEEASDELDQEN